MSWIFALLGLATAIAGGGAMAWGWPLVPLERGWTMVIAGAAIASGGLICLALAAVMGETRRTRRAIEHALEELAWARPIERVSAPALPAEPDSPPHIPTSSGFEKVEPVMPMMPSMPAAAPLAPLGPAREPKSSPERWEAIAARTALEHRDAAPEASASAEGAPAEGAGHEAAGQPDELQPARSFSVGDTTFVVFTDGSIEARTPKGARRFASMQEVRSYLEESASS